MSHVVMTHHQRALVAKHICQLMIGEVDVFPVAVTEENDVCWLSTWISPTGGKEHFFVKGEVVGHPLTTTRCRHPLDSHCKKAHHDDQQHCHGCWRLAVQIRVDA